MIMGGATVHHAVLYNHSLTWFSADIVPVVGQTLDSIIYLDSHPYSSARIVGLMLLKAVKASVVIRVEDLPAIFKLADHLPSHVWVLERINFPDSKSPLWRCCS